MKKLRDLNKEQTVKVKIAKNNYLKINNQYYDLIE